jgi:hypothetical protein
MHSELERDVADDDKLVVALVVRKRGQAERLRREQLEVGGRHPSRGLAQPFRFEVSTERGQQVMGGALDGRAVNRAPVGRPRHLTARKGRRRASVGLRDC